MRKVSNSNLFLLYGKTCSSLVTQPARPYWPSRTRSTPRESVIKIGSNWGLAVVAVSLWPVGHGPTAAATDKKVKGSVLWGNRFANYT